MEAEPDREIASELSTSELQDLVVAARPNSQAEALFIMDVLEEAGIPVAASQENLVGFTSAYIAGDLRVPRALLEKAQAEIQKARSLAAERSINLAFEPENVLETLEDSKPDPIMFKMAELRDYSDADRDRTLRAIIKQWMVNNDTPEIKIAKYLAAAGLNEQQAREMVESVSKEERAEVESAHSSRFLYGIGQLGLGFILIVLRFWLARTDGQRASGLFWSWAPMALILGGLVTIFISLESKPISTLSGAKPPDE